MARPNRFLFYTLALACLGAFCLAPSGGSGPSCAWTPARRLTHAPGLSTPSINFKRSVATTPGRGVHAVWTDARDGAAQVYYGRSPDNGTYWQGNRRLSPVGGEEPAIATAGSRIYVGWHDEHATGSDLFLRRSPDGGRNFGALQSLTDSGSAAHVSLAAFGPRVYAVWGDTRSGVAEIYLRASDDGGATWHPEVMISDAPYESWVPSVTAWEDRVHVAWVDYRDGNEEEYLRQSFDGGRTWGPVRRMTVDLADSWAPSIASWGPIVALAWFDRRDAGLTDAQVEAVLDEGLALLGLPADPPPPRDPAVYYLPLFQQRVADKKQSILAAAPTWVAGGGDPALLEALLTEFETRYRVWTLGWSIYFTRSTDGGVHWEPARRISAPNGPALRPSVALEAGELDVVWFDGRHGDTELYTRRSIDAGRTFLRERRLTWASGESLRPSVAVGGGRVHVVWRDDRAGNPEIFYKGRGLSVE